MIAEPAFHDKNLIGNGERCQTCKGTGRVHGSRGLATSRRCKSCKGSGRAPLPAEVIINNTRPVGRQAALVREAHDAREASALLALRDAARVEAPPPAAKKPPPVIFGLPLPIGHGRRPDGSTYITCGDPQVHGKSFSYPGTGPETLAFVQMMNAIPTIRAALKAVRAECRDPDSDAFHSTAAGELVDEALRALGERL